MNLTLSRERLGTLLGAARGKRIVVIGDSMLDVYLTGDADRISPEAPVPVVRVRGRQQALGGAANVAQNVVAIGCRCDLVSAVGEDDGGERLRALMGSQGIETGALVRTSRPTTVKTRVVARSQQLVRIDEEDDADFVGAENDALAASALAEIDVADALVLEDYNKGVLVPSLISQAIEAARARGIPVVVDPKFRNFFAYRGATVFKPNRRELEAALGAAVVVDEGSTLPSALKRLGVQHLLLTLGERGMVLVSEDGTMVRVPTVARGVYDVVGAGDTVTAYLAAILAAGGTVSECAIIANIAAGIEVGKLGAATVSAEEVLAYADEHALHA
ncbi:MAG: D-glycero-beta-D-manno-heptose-7-phosphate kinase [Gemmatimonadaceae bacterium]